MERSGAGRVAGRSAPLVATALSLFAIPVAAQENRAQEIFESMLARLDPDLIQAAETRGIYDRNALPVLRTMNPFFIRGDFNGDGEMDVAFWVQNRMTKEPGVAILHGTLDDLYVFGAGRPRPDRQLGSSNEIRVDAWHLISAGHTEAQPIGDVPEIGVVEGQPFTFRREALEFVNLGKSAFVFYWSDGKYREFWTAE
jgi:hypothetical protein